MTRIQGGDVRFGDARFVRELLLQPVDRGLLVAPVHPEHESQRPHIAAAQGFALMEAGHLHGLERLLRDVELEDAEAGERVVVERARRVPRFAQVALVELPRVGDHQAAGAQVGQVRDERGRIHRDQRVEIVARRGHVVRPELDLERRDAEGRTGRRANLRREVGERGQIVPDQAGLLRETGAGELHAVARIAGEADDDALDRSWRFRGCH